MLRAKNRIKTVIVFVVMDGQEEKEPDASAKKRSRNSNGFISKAE